MRSRNAAERKTPADVLPPFLTTLNENGSPKFNLVKLREKGRLRIGTELNERKEVLASRTQRSMRMRFITSANEEGDDDLRECWYVGIGSMNAVDRELNYGSPYILKVEQLIDEMIRIMTFDSGGRKINEKKVVAEPLTSNELSSNLELETGGPDLVLLTDLSRSLVLATKGAGRSGITGTGGSISCISSITSNALPSFTNDHTQSVNSVTWPSSEAMSAFFPVKSSRSTTPKL
ncbi:hypothetical protein Leryth_000614 [Lithospermum erythrorhizon]|nr:hypothetical protein Leryth_000614 [Lithospermum erythrorhizon]